MHSPAAYLFDMDGLLLDTERVFLETGLPLLMALGMGADEAEAFFVSLVGSSSAHTMSRLGDIAGGDAGAQALYTSWRAAFRARLDQSVPLRPTVRDTLDRLTATGATMAVVTSTHGANARHHLTQAGLIDHFACVICGDEVPASKPDPAPYLSAASALGVAAVHCAAFEDSDLGTTSAVRAGCMTTQIPDLRPQDIPLPDLGQSVAKTLADAVDAWLIPAQ